VYRVTVFMRRAMPTIAKRLRWIRADAASRPREHSYERFSSSSSSSSNSSSGNVKIITRLRGGLTVIREPRRPVAGEGAGAITCSVISLRALVAFSRQFLSLIFRIAANCKSNRRVARATRETRLPLSRAFARTNTPPRIRSIGGNGAANAASRAQRGHPRPSVGMKSTGFLFERLLRAARKFRSGLTPARGISAD